MEHTLSKSLFIILPNLTCFFFGKKSSFHTCTPGKLPQIFVKYWANLVRVREGNRVPLLRPFRWSYEGKKNKIKFSLDSDPYALQ